MSTNDEQSHTLRNAFFVYRTNILQLRITLQCSYEHFTKTRKFAQPSHLCWRLRSTNRDWDANQNRIVYSRHLVDLAAGFRYGFPHCALKCSTTIIIENIPMVCPPMSMVALRGLELENGNSTNQSANQVGWMIGRVGVVAEECAIVACTLRDGIVLKAV